MMRIISPRLRLSLAILLLSPSLTCVQAAAQVVRASAVASPSAAVAGAGAVLRAPLALGAATSLAPSLSIDLAPAANLVPALAPAAPAFSPAASRADAAVPAASAILPRAAAPAEAIAVNGTAAAALSGVFRSDSKAAASPAAAETRMNVLFDGEGTLRASGEAVPVAASLRGLAAASTLERAVPSAAASAKAVPPAARSKRTGMSLGAKALIVAALLIAIPGLALAAPVAGPIGATAAASLSLLASLQPLAAAAGALAGAIYGMFAARPKDGSAASSGEVFSSILHYGVLGGAGAYVLMDLSQIVFTGASAIGLQPLTSAIAIAALGRTAFQDKFTDPNTTGADRIMGAFPAVAAAVGISVGVIASALVLPTLTFVIATSLMAVTGVATAFYASTYKPARSYAAGPSMMAKGYVLQALMMGLALAVKSPFLFWPFAAMGAAGFALVLWATALQIWSLRPGAPAQPLPPSPPPKTVPPATPVPTPLPGPKP
ncbi:MAG: hypothetical protein ACHQ2Z_10950 [Elusimicrobiota bacterium]